ncbi:hypothetical protein ASG90_18010 [Nocardioides sp. Soil797]|nr:hypothetical protein ASG90_18010 [Nocardioides sp. Soil797]
MTTYGVIGVGALGQAVVTGLALGPVGEAPSVVVGPRSATRSTALAAAHPNVEAARDNQAVLDAADVVLICLRQQDWPEIAGLSWRADHVVVSAVAGVGEDDLLGAVSPATAVARAVPMISVAERRWRTPVCPPVPEAMTLFEHTGGAIAVHTDDEFDAIFTGLGTVAAFFDYLATIEGFLVDHGVAAADARSLLAGAFATVGAQLGAQGEPDFAAMLREHATPGGGNEQLATLMRGSGVNEATRNALDEVFRRQTGTDEK